jgi:predicted exporter
MNKFLMFLCVLGFLFGFVGTASAIFTDTAVFDSEPGIMLLFGFSLIGLAGFVRKKLYKKALRSQRLSPAHS